MTGEVLREALRPGILEHPLDLGVKFFRLRQVPLVGRLQQFPIGQRGPQEIGEPARDGVIVKARGPEVFFLRQLSRARLLEEQEMRRGENGLVAVRHRFREGVSLVEPIMHQLDVVLPQFLAHGPAQRSRQEIADQALGVFPGPGGSGHQGVVIHPEALGAVGGDLRDRPPVGFRLGDRARLDRHIFEQTLIALRRPGTDGAFDFQPLYHQSRAFIVLQWFFHLFHKKLVAVGQVPGADPDVGLAIHFEGFLENSRLVLRHIAAGTQLESAQLTYGLAHKRHRQRLALRAHRISRDRDPIAACLGNHRRLEHVVRPAGMHNKGVVLQPKVLAERALVGGELVDELPARTFVRERHVRGIWNGSADRLFRRLLIAKQMRRRDIEGGADIVETRGRVVLGQCGLELDAHVEREQIPESVFILGAVEPAEDDAPLFFLPFERRGVKLLVQPVRHHVDVLLRRPFPFLGRHFAGHELIMHVNPVGHRAGVAKVGLQFIEPKSRLLHVGPMTVRMA